MKAISLVKFFTVVSFLVIGGFDAFAGTASKGDVDELTDCSSYDNKTDCERWQKEYLKKQNKEEQKETASECKSLLKTYDDSAKKMSEECGYMNVEDNAKCRQMANNCKKGLDAFGTEERDSESAAGAFADLLGVYGQMQQAQTGGGSAAVASGCVIENDDRAAEKEERIDDKITRLREEIADLKDKAVEADNNFNEKKQDIEKEMLDLENDYDKEKFQRQTKSQEDAGRMQKAIMESEKKRKDNIAKMASLQTKVANVAYEQQEIVLSFSDDVVQRGCKDMRDQHLQKTIAAKDAELNKNKGADVKKVKAVFTNKESQQIKKDLKLIEMQCLQKSALDKKKALQKAIDQKRELQSQIERLETANSDEQKAIDQEIKQMEELKKISDAEEAKALEAKLKKLNSLNVSVTDLERTTAQKKQSYAEKAKAKEDQINKLILDKQNVKSRFAKVSSIAETEKSAAANFVEKCCTNSDASKNDKSCHRVMSVEQDVSVSGAKPYKAPKTVK